MYHSRSPLLSRISAALVACRSISGKRQAVYLTHSQPGTCQHALKQPGLRRSWAVPDCACKHESCMCRCKPCSGKRLSWRCQLRKRSSGHLAYLVVWILSQDCGNEATAPSAEELSRTDQRADRLIRLKAPRQAHSAGAASRQPSGLRPASIVSGYLGIMHETRKTEDAS